MEEYIENIVYSDIVQELLKEVREANLVTPNKYIEICVAVQNRINIRPDFFLLTPVEIASLIERVILIYSNKKYGTNYHISSIDKSIDIALQQMLGVTDILKRK